MTFDSRFLIKFIVLKKDISWITADLSCTGEGGWGRSALSTEGRVSSSVLLAIANQRSSQRLSFHICFLV